jgi:hypothetical protein
MQGSVSLSGHKEWRRIIDPLKKSGYKEFIDGFHPRNLFRQ